MYVNDIFTVEIPSDQQFEASARNKSFRAQRYTCCPRRGVEGASEWRLVGTALNKDGSLHRGGQTASRLLDLVEVPVTARQQAARHYRDLAASWAAYYTTVADGVAP